MTGTEADNAAIPDEPVAYDPPRFRWLKRTAVGFSILIVLLIGVRVIWGAAAERRLAAFVDACKAAGEPIEPEDFERSALPDNENAAILINEAITAFNTAGFPIPYTFDPFHPSSTTWMDDTRAVLTAYDQTLSRLRQLRSCPEADWGPTISAATRQALWEINFACRHIPGLLACAARYHHKIGNDAEALECVRDAMDLRDRFGGTILTGNSYDAMVVPILQSMLPSLKIESLKVGNSADHSMASRRQVAALIEGLLAEDSLRHDWERNWYIQRAFYVQHTRRVHAQVVLASASGVLTGASSELERTLDAIPPSVLSPLWTTELLDSMPPFSVAAHWARQPNYPTAVAVLREAISTGSVSSSLNGDPDPSGRYIGGSLESYFERFAERRLAATALAIRWSEIDYDRRPELLDELVPAYLPAVPADPFSKNCEPIRYAPNARRPCVYSVGVNGKDDGGSGDRQDDRRTRLDIPFRFGSEPISTDRAVEGSE
jgi:hypothetical protein